MMTDLDREIDMRRRTRVSAPIRRRRYQKPVGRARRSLKELFDAVTWTEAALVTLDVLPNLRAMATRVVSLMRGDVNLHRDSDRQLRGSRAR